MQFALSSGDVVAVSIAASATSRTSMLTSGRLRGNAETARPRRRTNGPAAPGCCRLPATHSLITSARQPLAGQSAIAAPRRSDIRIGGIHRHRGRDDPTRFRCSHPRRKGSPGVGSLGRPAARRNCRGDRRIRKCGLAPAAQSPEQDCRTTSSERLIKVATPSQQTKETP